MSTCETCTGRSCQLAGKTPAGCLEQDVQLGIVTIRGDADETLTCLSVSSHTGFIVPPAALRALRLTEPTSTREVRSGVDRNSPPPVPSPPQSSRYRRPRNVHRRSALPLWPSFSCPCLPSIHLIPFLKIAHSHCPRICCFRGNKKSVNELLRLRVV